MNEFTGDSATLGLLTCSFAGDYPLCETLVSSIRDYAPGVFHRVVVPAVDLRLFAGLAGPTTEIVASSRYLPSGVRDTPRAPNFLRKRISRLHRDVYLFKGKVVRGWLVQQVLKLAAAASMPTDMIMHCDSDTFLVRRPRLSDYWIADKPRLYSEPGGGRDPMHFRWHAVAASLLGLPVTEYFGSDWIGPLVTWHRPTVQELLRVVSRVAIRPWAEAILSRPDFSEYTLYGAFVQNSGLCLTPHALSAVSLSLNNWVEPLRAADEVDAYCAGLKPEHLGGLIQSTQALPTSHRRAIVASLHDRADSFNQIR